MAKVLFYEKPGCANNTRQKELLELAGHEVVEKNLLTNSWTAEELAKYLNGKQPADCFNPSAPMIKRGEIDPGEYTMESAIEIMQRDPILIKRPLMMIEENDEVTYIQGFDKEEINRLIGLANRSDKPEKYLALAGHDLVTCKKTSGSECK